MIGSEAVPLDKDVEQSQGKADSGFKIEPIFVRHLFEVADVGQHGEHGFDDHMHVLFTALAQAQIGGLPVGFGKAGIGKDHHFVAELLDQMAEGRAIIDIGGITFPVHDPPQMVEEEAEFAAYDPATVRLAFLADLLGAASFPARMKQFNAVAVNDAE